MEQEPYGVIINSRPMPTSTISPTVYFENDALYLRITVDVQSKTKFDGHDDKWAQLFKNSDTTPESSQHFSCLTFSDGDGIHMIVSTGVTGIPWEGERRCFQIFFLYNQLESGSHALLIYYYCLELLKEYNHCVLTHPKAIPFLLHYKDGRGYLPYPSATLHISSPLH